MNGFDDESYFHELEIYRPDEWSSVLFDNEIDRYNRGFTGGVFGNSTIKTGGAKSVNTAVICQDYWEDFDPFKHIVFSPAGGLNLMNDFEKTKLKGGMMIFEEAQNYASNRTWFSLWNKTIMHSIATFRNLRCGCFFVTPMKKMIDKDVHKLMRFHAISYLRSTPYDDKLEGYLDFSEVYTFNDDKDIGYRKPLFYCPPDECFYTPEESQVFASKQLLRDVKQHIDEYKTEYRLSLQEEAEAYDAAEKNLIRRSGIISPRVQAEKLLQDGDIISELNAKDKIESKTINAFFPNGSTKNNQAVHWWVQKLWNELKMKRD